MKNKIASLILELEKQENQLSPSRRNKLDQIAQHFSAKKEQGELLQALVVCTHNSRRSHIGQLWFMVAAEYYNVEKLSAYSAGTMATELNSRVVKALKSVGFSVDVIEKAAVNQRYGIYWSGERNNEVFFSKTYTDQSIPKKGVTAIMVCTDADENCPFIPGADMRFSLPFEDPKVSDDTSREAVRYLESVHEIGREIVYILKRV